MERISVVEAEQNLAALVEKIVLTPEPVVITNAQGDAAKIIPIPKPIKVVNGRPIYNLKDMQFLDVPTY